MGRISNQVLKDLIDKIDRLVLEAQISEEPYYLEDLGKLANEIEGYLKDNPLDQHSAQVILEKIKLINSILQGKSDKIIKTLENKQKEEKLIQQAYKLLSDTI